MGIEQPSRRWSGDGIPDPQSRQSIDLRKGTRDDDAVVIGRPIDERSVVRRRTDVVMVGLVNQDIRRRRKRSNKCLDVLPACEAARRIVWVADVDQTRRTTLRPREHSFEIVGIIIAQRNANDFGTGALCKVENQVEGRHRGDELLARADESIHRHPHDFTRTAPQNDLAWCHAMEFSNFAPQRGQLHFRIMAARIKRGLLHCGGDIRRWAISIFVSV